VVTIARPPAGADTNAAPAPPTGRPDGPQGHFLTGVLPELGRDPLGFLTACARRYGDFVPLRFGLLPGLLLSHPDLAEEVLVTQHRYFVKSPTVRRLRVLGNGLLTSEGEVWRRQRRLMQPAFHRRRVAGYAETMVRQTERMLAGWRDGETRDVVRDMTALTMGIVTETLFGAGLPGGPGTLEELGAALAAIGEHFNSRTYSLRFFLPDAVPTPGNLRLRRAIARLDRVIYGIIGERRRGGLADGGDLLSLLLRARDEPDEEGGRASGQGAGGMTDRQLRDEVMTLFLAGHDTTALALSWTWALLAQHPVAEARLHAELREVLGGRAPAAADLPRLRYTEHVLTEALRLYPPAWAVGRQAVADCEIGGRRVRRGTVVTISQWVIHRDPRFFADADAFRPERWADGLAGRLPRYAYFPFGGGPRVCIGAGFAMTEAVLLLATIAQRFRLSLEAGFALTPQPFVTLRPKHGVRTVLRRR
jgi:cytochrome P450